jgi:hypothetical protein
MNEIGYKDAVYVGERRKQKNTDYGNTVLYTDILCLMIVNEWRLGFACPEDGAGSTGRSATGSLQCWGGCSGQVQAKDCPITSAQAEK